MLQAIKPEQASKSRTRAKIINTFRLLTASKICVCVCVCIHTQSHTNKENAPATRTGILSKICRNCLSYAHGAAVGRVEKGLASGKILPKYISGPGTENQNHFSSNILRAPGVWCVHFTLSCICHRFSGKAGMYVRIHHAAYDSHLCSCICALIWIYAWWWYALKRKPAKENRKWIELHVHAVRRLRIARVLDPWLRTLRSESCQQPAASWATWSNLWSILLT